MRSCVRFLIIAASAVWLAASSAAQTANLFFNFNDPQHHAANVSQVTIVPLWTNAADSGVLLSRFFQPYTRANTPSLSSGTFTLTNISVGSTIEVTFIARGGGTTIDVKVPWDTPDGATIGAWTNIVNVQNGIFLSYLPIVPGAQVGYVPVAVDTAGHYQWAAQTASSTNVGSGDMTGPSSSGTSNLVIFSNTTGKATKDSGVALTNVTLFTTFNAAVQATNSALQAQLVASNTAYQLEFQLSNTVYRAAFDTNGAAAAATNNNLGQQWVLQSTNKFISTNAATSNTWWSVVAGGAANQPGTHFGSGANGTNGGAAFGRAAIGYAGTAFGDNADGHANGATVGASSSAFEHGANVGEVGNATEGGANVGELGDASINGANLGSGGVASNQGVSAGWNTLGYNYGVGLGMGADGHGFGNIAIGSYNAGAITLPALVPDTWTYTIELGAGTATVQGALNFRTFPLFDTNGYAFMARLATNDATASDGWVLSRSGTKGKWIAASGSGTVMSVDVAQQGFSSSGAVTGSGTVTLTRNADVNFGGFSGTNVNKLAATNSAIIGGLFIDNTNVLQVNTLAGARKMNLNTNGDLFLGGNAYMGGNLLATTNQLLDATTLGASSHIKTGATTNLVSSEDFTGYTNSVAHTNYGTATNLTFYIDGNNHSGTITNGPDVWLTPSIAGAVSGSWSWEVTTNIALHWNTSARWLAGSNGISAGVFSITNGEFDATFYGATNFPHVKVAIGENQ